MRTCKQIKWMNMNTAEADGNVGPLGWRFLPTEALITIFGYLNYQDLCRCGQVCKLWSEVEGINCLWRRRFSIDFNVQGAELSDGSSWKEEYKRLTDSVPSVECKCLTDHKDEVLHVAFSHGGAMFCTCSKDATIKVFAANPPYEILFTKDMGLKSMFQWSYSQFSQFNSCDSELLVSGRRSESNVGEITIYGVHSNEFELQARIDIRPYDVMGTWLNESYILSACCHQLPLRHSLSEVLLNKSSQEIHNLRQSIVKRLYMFKNDHANAVIYLKVADMTQVMSNLCKLVSSGNYKGNLHEMHLRILLQHATKDKDLLQSSASSNAQTQTAASSLHNIQTNINTERDRMAGFLSTPCAKRPLLDEDACSKTEKPTDLANVSTDDKKDNLHDVSSVSETGEIMDFVPMSYKIFLAFTGTDRGLNYQIGIKFITEEQCDDVKPVDIEHQRSQAGSRLDNGFLYHRIIISQWDHVIDVGGQLLGMEVSPCGQYLYASYRKILNPDSPEQDNPCNISSTVTISVFDLVSMTELRILNGPSAVSSVFYLYLSCAGEYVASGSEDKHGYLWNKYYGCLVSKLKHDSVVNCVAINPTDTNMAVSVSDDHTIKIWHSKAVARSFAHSMRKSLESLD